VKLCHPWTPGFQRPSWNDEIYKNENLTTKRPGTGISPMCFDEVLGMKARRDFAEGDLIEP
jgi:sialic acid synthase SpsE